MKNNKLIDAIGLIDDKYIEEAHKKNKTFFNWAFVGKALTAALCLYLVVMIIPSTFRMGASKDEAITTEDIYEYQSTNGSLAYDSDVAYATEAKGGVGGVGNSSYIDNEIDKKLIINGNINIETLEFDSVIEKLTSIIDTHNAYIQSSSISGNNNRYYYATVRIPKDSYQDFVSRVKELGNVTWYSENTDDVTTSYMDLQAKINSLKAEEEKVLEFYDKASNLEELMEVEARLTDIRYQIESCESRLNNYDVLTEYSTLNIDICETKTLSETNNNFGSRLKLAFKNSFYNFTSSLENFITDIVYNIWTILMLVIAIVVIIIIVKKIKNKR